MENNVVAEGYREKKHNCTGAVEHCKYLQYAQSEVENIIAKVTFNTFSSFNSRYISCLHFNNKLFSRQFKRKAEECMMTYQADVIMMIKNGYDESSVSISNLFTHLRDCDLFPG